MSDATSGLFNVCKCNGTGFTRYVDNFAHSTPPTPECDSVIFWMKVSAVAASFYATTKLESNFSSTRLDKNLQVGIATPKGSRAVASEPNRV